MEQDVCGLVLSIDVRVHQPFVDETGVGRVLVANYEHVSKVTPVPTVPSIENPDLQNPGLQDAEVDRICLDNVEVCAEVHRKSVMPQMLRLEECIEK